MIGHELTAKHGLDHAQTLAIVLPSVMAHQRTQKREKLLQYAARVWNITDGDELTRMNAAIDKTREFFESVGVKTRLSDYNISADAIPAMLDNLEKTHMLPLGEHKDIDRKAVEAILLASL